MKKILSAMIAILVLASFVTAFADFTASRSVVNSVIKESAVFDANGKAIDSKDFKISFSVDEDTTETKEKTEEQIHAEEKKEQIAVELEKLLSEDTKTVSDYFEEDIQKTITEVLPENIDPKDLKLNTMETLVLEGYKSEMGDISMELSLNDENDFAEDAVLVVMLGVEKTQEDEPAEKEQNADTEALASNMNWYPFPANLEEGKLKVTFSQDVLETINRPAVMLILEAEKDPE